MRRTSLWSRGAAVLAGALLVAMLSGLAACSAPGASSGAQQTQTPAGTAGIGTATAVPTVGPFNLTFTTKYSLNDCGAGTPAGTLCVATSGTGKGTKDGANLQSVGLQRSSSYAPGDGSACAPATTSGTLQLSTSDSVTFTGSGTFCLALHTATFTYSITGGTGAYQNASGSGVINVPPPSSSTDDTETWTGSLQS